MTAACRYHDAMHTIDEHEAMKSDPARLAVETGNPRAQWGDGTTVLFVWRDCHGCGSTIAVTVAQEAAARDITMAREVL